MKKLHRIATAVFTPCFLAALALSYFGKTTFAQSRAADPGVRAGTAGAGGPANGLSPRELAAFDFSTGVFREIVSVQGHEPGAPVAGLGPRFNGRSCEECHAQPTTGGTSPLLNPQIVAATDFGATNVIPEFISANGPVREVRMILNADGTLDGSVHELFTISGRKDAVDVSGPDRIVRTCKISQPNFAAAFRDGNLVFRIPTPIFGLGEVEAVTDASLQKDSLSSLATYLGIVTGVFNRTDSNGSIGRFGWKAQHNSLLGFAAEAYNVEQGVTNELFPQEREQDPNCQFNDLPEDHTRLAEPPKVISVNTIDSSSNIVNFATFMRLSEPPMPVPFSASSQRGLRTFTEIGCSVCHVQQHSTGVSSVEGQSHRLIQPFSDFALHHMGTNLADGVNQGSAGPDQFRTAPLWGIGQRIFFMHDGRTRDLLQAILAHADLDSTTERVIRTSEFTTNGQTFRCATKDFFYRSEANQVIENFLLLPASSQQDILNFLRSL